MALGLRPDAAHRRDRVRWPRPRMAVPVAVPAGELGAGWHHVRTRGPPAGSTGPRTLPRAGRSPRAPHAALAEHHRGEDVRGPRGRRRRVAPRGGLPRADQPQRRSLRGLPGPAELSGGPRRARGPESDERSNDGHSERRNACRRERRVRGPGPDDPAWPTEPAGPEPPPPLVAGT